MISAICRRMKGEGGFTLIEPLVVIIIIAILAAIAIPTFLGQRQKAQDAAAKSLVRNAMTAAESQYVDTRTFANASAIGAAQAIEPSITFVDTAKAANAGAAASGATALATVDDVNFGGDATSYSLGTRSESGNKFGVYVDKASSGGTTFAKYIGTTTSSGW